MGELDRVGLQFRDHARQACPTLLQLRYLTNPSHGSPDLYARGSRHDWMEFTKAVQGSAQRCLHLRVCSTRLQRGHASHRPQLAGLVLLQQHTTIPILGGAHLQHKGIAAARKEQSRMLR